MSVNPERENEVLMGVLFFTLSSLLSGEIRREIPVFKDLHG